MSHFPGLVHRWKERGGKWLLNETGLTKTFRSLMQTCSQQDSEFGQERKDTINEHQNNITAGHDHIICLVTVELMQHVLISENEDGAKADDDMDGAEGGDDAADDGPEDKDQKAEDVAEVHVKDVAEARAVLKRLEVMEEWQLEVNKESLKVVDENKRPTIEWKFFNPSAMVTIMELILDQPDAERMPSQHLAALACKLLAMEVKASNVEQLVEQFPGYVDSVLDCGEGAEGPRKLRPFGKWLKAEHTKIADRVVNHSKATTDMSESNTALPLTLAQVADFIQEAGSIDLGTWKTIAALNQADALAKLNALQTTVALLRKLRPGDPALLAGESFESEVQLLQQALPLLTAIDKADTLLQPAAEERGKDSLTQFTDGVSHACSLIMAFKDAGSSRTFDEAAMR